MIMQYGMTLAENGRMPDRLIRHGIRRLLEQRLETQEERDAPALPEDAPVAVHTAAANEQHYELPADFFEQVLGPNLKYSCCFYRDEAESLAEAEATMLRLTCERAAIADGMRVLDLGCGWGSMSLWLAKHYPNSRITAVSNSLTQGHYIRQQCALRGLQNVSVVTADVNRFRPDQRFDRVVSVEMLEHVRNHSALFARLHDWLLPGGQVFVHIFCHRAYSYLYETEGNSNWMGRYFFTGGMMPSFDLLPQCDEHLVLRESWKVDGTHYARTCRHWLENLDTNRAPVLKVLSGHYGPASARKWFNRWRMFFMACEELFAYSGGHEWHVGHYRFARRADG